MPEAVEVEEQERALPHSEPIPVPTNRMIGEIPRGRVRAGMAKDHNPPEAPRPLVEVLLLREPSRLDAVVAPFQAAVAPPLEACHAVRVAAERDPADVIAAVLLDRSEASG